MTVAAELGLSEVGLEQIDCIVAGSVPLSVPDDPHPRPADAAWPQRGPHSFRRRHRGPRHQLLVEMAAAQL
jgi:hypothetical protein